MKPIPPFQALQFFAPFLALVLCISLVWAASEEEEFSRYSPERDGFTVHEWGLIRQNAGGQPLPHDTIPGFVHQTEAVAMR